MQESLFWSTSIPEVNINKACYKRSSLLGLNFVKMRNGDIAEPRKSRSESAAVRLYHLMSRGKLSDAMRSNEGHL